MKSKIKKLYAVLLLVLFFVTVPLFQSLIFSTQSEGVIYVKEDITLDFLHSDKKNILIYFGYVGCANICTPFLQKLNHLYESDAFAPLKKDTDVFFVNLTPNIEPEQADMFAKIFNEKFQGIYLSKKELFNIDRNFGLFFSDNLRDIGEVNHTDYLYFVQNKFDTKHLHSIYFTHPLRIQKLIDDMISKNYRGDE